MSYIKQTWADGEAGGTPINAARLNYIESGIEAAASVADTATTALATKANAADTPTLEELERCVLLGTVNSAFQSRRLGPVNMDQRIGGLSIATTATVAASDTNYWSISLVRLRAGQSALTIATRTTRATDGQGFTADSAWAFDDVAWLETARHLRKGDVLSLAFTKTGVPTDLTEVSVAVRYEPGVVPVIRDTFSRADSTTSLGVTDTGQAWSALVGTWGITGSTGYTTTTVEGFAAFDSGYSNFSVGLRIPATSGYFGLLFRVVDANNLWLLASDGLWLRSGGTWTNKGGMGGWVAGDVMSATVSGSTITAYKNGVQFASLSDATFVTATKVGLYANASPATGRYDDLELAV